MALSSISRSLSGWRRAALPGVALAASLGTAWAVRHSGLLVAVPLALLSLWCVARATGGPAAIGPSGRPARIGLAAVLFLGAALLFADLRVVPWVVAAEEVDGARRMHGVARLLGDPLTVARAGSALAALALVAAVQVLLRASHGAPAALLASVLLLTAGPVWLAGRRGTGALVPAAAVCWALVLVTAARRGRSRAASVSLGLGAAALLAVAALALVRGGPAAPDVLLHVELVAIVALALALVRVHEAFSGGPVVSVAGAILVLVLIAGRAERVQQEMDDTAAREGVASEVARFLAAVPDAQDVRLRPEELVRSPQVALLGGRHRVAPWDAGPLAAHPVLFLQAGPEPWTALHERAAATGTRVIRHGRDPHTFGVAVLGDGTGPPPAAAVQAPDHGPLLPSSSPAHHPEYAELALDGDPATRWTSGRPQEGGEWFQVDLPGLADVDEIRLDTNASPQDHPRSLEVLVSADGARFAAVPVAATPAAEMTIRLDPPARCRAVRLVQTAHAPANFWSIHEVSLRWRPVGPPPLRRAIAVRGLRTSAPTAGRVALAADDDPATRWDSGGHQKGGEWLEVELDALAPVGEVHLDTRGSPADFPRRLAVELSRDGRTFRRAAGPLTGAPRMRVRIDPPERARFVRLVQEGSDPFYFWSVHELSLWGEAASAAGRPEPVPPAAVAAAPRETLPDPLGLRMAPRPGDVPWATLDPAALRPSSFRLRAAHLERRALDGEPRTRWDSGGSQSGREWFQVDLPARTLVAELVLEQEASPQDFPRTLQVAASADGVVYEPVAVVPGRAGATTVPLDPPVACRSLRLQQLGSDPYFFWSIHELVVRGRPLEAAPSPPRWPGWVVLLAGAFLLAALGRRLPLAEARGWLAARRRSQGDRAGAGLLFGGLLLAACAGVLVARGHQGTGTFGIWAASVALALAAAWRSGRALRTRPTAADLVVLLLVFGMGAFYRLHRLDALPSGLWIDEVATARNALRVGHGPAAPLGFTPLLAPDGVQTSNLYLHLCLAVLRLGGLDTMAVKLVSVIPGILAAPLLYLLARRALSRPAAGATAAWLAVSLWHVTLSRWGWDEVLLTTLAIVSFARLWDALEHGDPWSFATAGALFGLALYGYVAARLALAAAVAALAVRLWQVREGPLRRGTAWFLAGAVVAALPVVVYWVREPDAFGVRTRELSMVPEIAAGNVDVLVQSVAAHLRMFHLAGDLNPRHNLPGRPMLDPVSGALMALGVVVAVARWRRSEALIALAWLGVGLWGGILSGLQEAPQAYRTGFVAPACYLLAGLGLQAVLERIRGRTGEGTRAVLAAALVAPAALLTYDDYFRARARSRDCWWSVYDGAPAAVTLREAERLLDRGTPVVLESSVGWAALRLEVDDLLARRRPGAPIRWSEAADVGEKGLGRQVMFVLPERLPALPGALRALPRRELLSPFGEPIVAAVAGDAGLLAGVGGASGAQGVDRPASPGG
jgi:hypothetical protein